MKKISDDHWDAIYDVLELVNLKAVNDRDWLDLVQKHPTIFTPEFMGLRACTPYCKQHQEHKIWTGKIYECLDCEEEREEVVAS